ncbi:DUF2259 domain-containing protein [Roseibium sp. RKSG952]|uniref:DUF2259 domain-containing protein n=1 Tax=Roseibium sp. RKSG952 TaxID=2529384 RepID=UPI0012BCE451|nr:DUF2259 domain-containing protein [Roseibium sp. RKSG952]MTH99458.1 DUF2259 domain-containing protein [Roseibium sp. RKSG952]
MLPALERIPYIILFSLCLFVPAPDASAGDQARLEILGFSEDGNHFAFEHYGIQDGSGFPYSEIFVVDVPQDRWVSPSPFRRRDEIDGSQGYDPDSLLAQTRTANRQTAQTLLSDTKISQAGETVGSNPVTELSADPFKMTVNPRAVVPPIDPPLEVLLAEYPLADAACASYGAETRGFQLTTVYQGEPTIRHADKAIPKSRGCPTGYRIAHVITHFPDGGPPVLAILVHVSRHGFEGPDGRFLAITGTF